MDFKATHKFQGDFYCAVAHKEDNSDYSWGSDPLNPLPNETIWLFSQESWDACDSAEYGVSHGSDFLCYTDGTLSNHTKDEVEILPA